MIKKFFKPGLILASILILSPQPGLVGQTSQQKQTGFIDFKPVYDFYREGAESQFQNAMGIRLDVIQGNEQETKMNILQENDYKLKVLTAAGEIPIKTQITFSKFTINGKPALERLNKPILIRNKPKNGIVITPVSASDRSLLSMYTLADDIRGPRPTYVYRVEGQVPLGKEFEPRMNLLRKVDMIAQIVEYDDKDLMVRMQLDPASGGCYKLSKRMTFKKIRSFTFGNIQIKNHGVAESLSELTFCPLPDKIHYGMRKRQTRIKAVLGNNTNQAHVLIAFDGQRVD